VTKIKIAKEISNKYRISKVRRLYVFNALAIMDKLGAFYMVFYVTDGNHKLG